MQALIFSFVSESGIKVFCWKRDLCLCVCIQMHTKEHESSGNSCKYREWWERSTVRGQVIHKLKRNNSIIDYSQEPSHQQGKNQWKGDRMVKRIKRHTKIIGNRREPENRRAENTQISSQSLTNVARVACCLLPQSA